MTDVTGGLDLNVVGGSITVHGNPRELRAESMDGAVTIDGAPEWMRVKTATGDIALRGGQDVGASTISGTIDARNGEADHVKLESTTGAIRFALGAGARRDGGDGDAQRPDRDPARRVRRRWTSTRRR